MFEMNTIKQTPQEIQGHGIIGIDGRLGNLRTLQTFTSAQVERQNVKHASEVVVANPVNSVGIKVKGKLSWSRHNQSQSEGC